MYVEFLVFGISKCKAIKFEREKSQDRKKICWYVKKFRSFIDPELNPLPPHFTLLLTSFVLILFVSCLAKCLNRKYTQKTSTDTRVFLFFYGIYLWFLYSMQKIILIHKHICFLIKITLLYTFLEQDANKEMFNLVDIYEGKSVIEET